MPGYNIVDNQATPSPPLHAALSHCQLLIDNQNRPRVETADINLIHRVHVLNSLRNNQTVWYLNVTKGK